MIEGINRMNLAEKLDDVTIERTYDTDMVRFILSEKELLKRSCAVSVDIFDPENQKDVIYLLVYVNDSIVGVNVFHMFNNEVCAQGHVNYLPEFWGSGLEKYTKLSIDWIFENTEFNKISCFAPEYYPEVEKHAALSGLKVDCVLDKSTLHNGILMDQKLMSINKGDK